MKGGGPPDAVKTVLKGVKQIDLTTTAEGGMKVPKRAKHLFS